jgi:hypothetical protein
VTALRDAAFLRQVRHCDHCGGELAVPNDYGRLLASRDGWTLTEEAVHPGDLYVQFALRGMAVTPGQARAIAASRAGRTSGQVRHPWRGVPGGIELSWEESQLVKAGADPFDVLLPRFVVRALTREELTGA